MIIKQIIVKWWWFDSILKLCRKLHDLWRCQLSNAETNAVFFGLSEFQTKSTMEKFIALMSAHATHTAILCNIYTLPRCCITLLKMNQQLLGFLTKSKICKIRLCEKLQEIYWNWCSKIRSNRDVKQSLLHDEMMTQLYFWAKSFITSSANSKLADSNLYCWSYKLMIARKRRK